MILIAIILVIVSVGVFLAITKHAIISDRKLMKRAFPGIPSKWDFWDELLQGYVEDRIKGKTPDQILQEATTEAKSVQIFGLTIPAKEYIRSCGGTERIRETLTGCEDAYNIIKETYGKPLPRGPVDVLYLRNLATEILENKEG